MCSFCASRVLGRKVPKKKLFDAIGERVVSVAGDHVMGIREVDVLRMRHHLEKLLRGFLRHQVAQAPADQQRGDGDVANFLEPFFQLAIVFLGVPARLPSLQHVGVPMPVVAPVLHPPKILRQARQVLGSFSVRQIRGN